MAIGPTCSNPSRIEAAQPMPGNMKTAEFTEPVTLASFNQLVLAHQDDAFNFAYYLLGDPDTAADIVQKAFINAYMNIDKFRGPSFRSWLFKIIRNASIDEFRSARYRRNSSLDEMEDEEDRSVFTNNQESPEDSVINLEREQAIKNTLNRLEEPFRTILVLVDIQGLDYEEAAQIAGIPVGTAKSRLSRARQKFRSELGTVIRQY